MTGSVRVVIVNYRTADLVVKCLHSISAQLSQHPELCVVVVDNASEDGSVSILGDVIKKEGWSGWVSLIASERNGGFAYGNNLGIRKALGPHGRVDYVMLLNPDTIVLDGAIRVLVDFLQTNPRVGIAGSRLEDANGKVECSAHNTPSPIGELESGARLGILSRALNRYAVSPTMRRETHECEWVSGASLMIRGDVFEGIGGFDEKYFLYFEEVDFCLRARNAGWAVWYVPSSKVVHLEGASTGIRRIENRRPRYWYESRRRFFVKHYGVLGLMLADILWAIGRMSLVLRRALRLGSHEGNHDPSWFALDLLWGDFRSLFTKHIWRIARQEASP